VTETDVEFIYGVIGIINIKGLNYLLAISEHVRVAELDGAVIYRISDINYYPLNVFFQIITRGNQAKPQEDTLTVSNRYIFLFNV
jgi:hypothetical protein